MFLARGGPFPALNPTALSFLCALRQVPNFRVLACARPLAPNPALRALPPILSLPALLPGLGFLIAKHASVQRPEQSCFAARSSTNDCNWFETSSCACRVTSIPVETGKGPTKPLGKRRGEIRFESEQRCVDLERAGHAVLGRCSADTNASLAARTTPNP